MQPGAQFNLVSGGQSPQYSPVLEIERAPPLESLVKWARNGIPIRPVRVKKLHAVQGVAKSRPFCSIELLLHDVGIRRRPHKEPAGLQASCSVHQSSLGVCLAGPRVVDRKLAADGIEPDAGLPSQQLVEQIRADKVSGAPDGGEGAI